MSTNFEWVGVEDAPIELWTLIEEDGDKVDGYALKIGVDNGVCVEAERPDQLVEFARTVLRMTEDWAADK